MHLPLERDNADIMTRHHLLYERAEWRAHERSRRVHLLSAYVVDAVRYAHDYVHNVVKPVTVPGFSVLDALHEVGRGHIKLQDDESRLDYMISELMGFAETTPSYHQQHEMLEVATSLEAQMSIIGLVKVASLRPKTKYNTGG